MLLRALILSLPLALSAIASVCAQILPDATLPNPSAVTLDESTLTIDGGTASGTNLFHSFSEFSVPVGATASFNNALTIENILTRVTGENISSIDGLLQTNGTANLFLLNPNGIVFGRDSRLDVGGSFLATTADRLIFSDGLAFDARLSDSPPLLSVNVPVGLQLGSDPARSLGPIAVTGIGGGVLNSNPTVPFAIERGRGGLRVSSGETIALVGNGLQLQSATLASENGNVLLGSLEAGTVALADSATGWTMDIPIESAWQDVELMQGTTLDTSGTGGIRLWGRNITVTDGSLAFITHDTPEPSGGIEVMASESVRALGSNPSGTIPSGLRSNARGSTPGGDILVVAPRLRLENGGIIVSVALASGRGGNVTVRAAQTIDSLGTATPDPSDVSGIVTNTFGSASSGNITVQTDRLRISDGAGIFSASSGSGNSGDVRAIAESIEVVGINAGVVPPTNSLLASVTRGSGDGGTLVIETGTLRVLDGGGVTAGTVGSGNGGSVTIVASESVEVRGAPSANGLGGLGASALANSGFQVPFGLPSIPSGDAGNVNITTTRLIVADDTQVAVTNEGTGIAGNLNLNVDGLLLIDNQGRVAASTASGEGGNIDLVADTLQLRNSGGINTNAGDGDGGNININTDTLVALENSDITANADTGFGGQVSIEVRGIFGTQFREVLTSESDITATSALGAEFSGVVDINTPDIDSTSGLFELQTETIDASAIAFDNCRNYAGSEFYYTGNGGIPENPRQFLEMQIAVEDLGEPEPLPEYREEETSQLPTTDYPFPREATTWTIASDGKVSLISQVPTHAILPDLHCRSLSQ